MLTPPKFISVDINLSAHKERTGVKLTLKVKIKDKSILF